MNRYYPEGAEAQINETAKTEIYFYENTLGQPIAIGYSGKRSKPDFHVRFKSVERRQEHTTEFVQAKVNAVEEKIKYKAELKAKNEEAFKSIKVGDIFHSSWGYDQTNCDFYKLVSIKGKTGVFVEVGHQDTDRQSGYDSAYVRVDASKEIGQPFKKLLKGAGFTISSFQHANKVENPETEEFYSSWYA